MPTLTLSPELIFWVATLGKVIFIMTVVMLSGLVLSWVERKQSAIMQDRIGANRAALHIPGTNLKFRFMGLIHNLADALKGITKEDFIPPGSSKFLHTLAPWLACSTAVLAFAVLPFGGEWTVPGTQSVVHFTIAPMSVATLFVFAMLSIGVYGVVLAGYVSNNKWGILGALRASAQVISYEVAAGLTLMGCLLIYGTLDFREMVTWQQTHLFSFGLAKWGIFTQPLAFVLFLTAAIVEMKRVPFDLPEAESEIIGYFLEYSGMKFMLFMMAEFIETLLFAWIIVLVFLGGWDVPFMKLLEGGASGIYLGERLIRELPYYGVVVLQALAFITKIVFLCWLMMLIRWSLPRFRYDQIMHLGWKIMLPLALINVAVTALWLAYF